MNNTVDSRIVARGKPATHCEIVENGVVGEEFCTFEVGVCKLLKEDGCHFKIWIEEMLKKGRQTSF